MGKVLSERRKETLRTQIQAAIDRAQEDAKKERFRQRVQVVQGGLNFYKKKEFARAAREFKNYLSVVEKFKNVGEGKLSPANFNLKEEQPELLLISGIYWDLAKIYDRAPSPKQIVELDHYLNQFVAFSRGLPHEPLSLDTIRKYFITNKCLHRANFRMAFKNLGGTTCFVVSSLLDWTEPQTLKIFEQFRDQVLTHSKSGRRFTVWYYHRGPMIADFLNHCPKRIRRSTAKSLDRLGKIILKRYQFDLGGK